MRLIDADELVKLLMASTMSNGTLINTNTMLAIVEKMPTAYDVEKVVAELESEADRWHDSGKEYNDEKELGVAGGFRYAIPIIRKGGVNDE